MSWSSCARPTTLAIFPAVPRPAARPRTRSEEHTPALVFRNSGPEPPPRIPSSHPDVVVILCSPYDVSDLPSGAAASGAAAYVSKEQLGADTLRRLWENRDSGSFGSA